MAGEKTGNKHNMRGPLACSSLLPFIPLRLLLVIHQLLPDCTPMRLAKLLYNRVTDIVTYVLTCTGIDAILVLMKHFGSPIIVIEV